MLFIVTQYIGNITLFVDLTETVSNLLTKKYFTGLSVPVTEPTDEDEDEFDEEEDSSEADDDGRIYKNPRNSPSTLCPRDEEQATLLAQKCLRKCSSDEDCKSKKKKCLCDGPCGMSCIKPGNVTTLKFEFQIDLLLFI